MRKLIVANWKENPPSEKKALELFSAIARAKRPSGADVVICPPFIYLEALAGAAKKLPIRNKKNLAIGAQDAFWDDDGAHTSEVGPKMLRRLGARYAIVGHSERRRELGETDTMINRKIKSLLKDGARPILCVGESTTIRRKGLAAARAFIKNQLKKDLAGIRAADIKKVGGMAIAYEPMWAIGSGKNDKPEDARAMAIFIRAVITAIIPHTSYPNPLYSIPFLYGGSVNSKNAGDYVQYREIDGALVGGASLNAKEFIKMINNIHG